MSLPHAMCVAAVKGVSTPGGLAMMLWVVTSLAAVGLLSGLKHMHERNILHRDVKPANIFLTAADAVRGMSAQCGIGIVAVYYVYYLACKRWSDAAAR